MDNRSSLAKYPGSFRFQEIRIGVTNFGQKIILLLGQSNWRQRGRFFDDFQRRNCDNHTLGWFLGEIASTVHIFGFFSGYLVVLICNFQFTNHWKSAKMLSGITIVNIFNSFWIKEIYISESSYTIFLSGFHSCIKYTGWSEINVR